MSEGDRIFKPVIAFAIAATSMIAVSVMSYEYVQVETNSIGTSYERREVTEYHYGTSSYRNVSRWMQYVTQRLLELGQGLYDFTGLKIPSPATIERARSVVIETLKDNTPTPSVVPSEDGAVVMIWRKSGWDVEFEITESEANVWAHRRIDSSGWYGPLSQHGADFSSLLDELSNT
jgi:hypothetical protein